ncbi:choice-of-anchor Q domain-containing protein [Ancylomarina longa]|uniref:Right-handed parallel beta-helix repeat-containing protein n=1 Tax=Ancylomarina longa TaxID=2487017 RepID=A0A434AGQ1_9BACT|nr:choice-of-anchor Q domain-containing protein [Ancylomarina longa]RUT73561.1 hypothetical protein DLK05_12710 [Ancylomarina longa]
MSKSHLYLIIVLLLAFCYACEKGNDFSLDRNSSLSFSVDTLSFDTLLTGNGSTTKQIKIYNRSTKEIHISRIYLEDENSPYRINLNGEQGKEWIDVDLAENDSLFAFVEVALNPANEDAPRLLKDQLVFDRDGEQQKVVFETWAQDVYRITGNISNTQTWTANRPYLIVDSTYLNQGVTLTIEEGGRVYFKKGAALHIKGEINVLGSFEKPVYFGSERQEKLYDQVPAQWGGIYFYEESKNNKFSHFILENGSNALHFQGASSQNNSLELEYGIIRNFNQTGIYISNTLLRAHDLLISNCGEECLSMDGESKCELYHSTFYNTWFYFSRSSSILKISENPLLSLTIGNSIIWGIKNDEIELTQTDNIQLVNSLIKLSDSKQNEYTSVFSECIFNENPLFSDAEVSDFTLQVNSSCINIGNVEYGNLFPIDSRGNRRNEDNAPDLGTYEYAE